MRSLVNWCPLVIAEGLFASKHCSELRCALVLGKCRGECTKSGGQKKGLCGGEGGGKQLRSRR